MAWKAFRPESTSFGPDHLTAIHTYTSITIQGHQSINKEHYDESGRLA